LGDGVVVEGGARLAAKGVDGLLRSCGSGTPTCWQTCASQRGRGRGVRPAARRRAGRRADSSDAARPARSGAARKLGTPFQPELAMGAVADGGSPVVERNEDVIAMAGVDEAEFDAVCRRELAEIERRRHLYLGARIPPEALGAWPLSSTTASPRVSLIRPDLLLTWAIAFVRVNSILPSGS